MYFKGLKPDEKSSNMYESPDGICLMLMNGNKYSRGAARQ